jgi:hypothetical protein
MAYTIHLFDVLQAISKGLEKPVLYISFALPSISEWDEWIGELRQAAPYLFDGCVFKYPQILSDGNGYLVCDSKEEMEELYNLTVGDDGPTATNPYDGPVRVYALTSDGNENT